MNENNTLIFAYTRKQALADRVLVDVSDSAKSAGIRVPVAFTAAAYELATTSPYDLDGLERADAVCMTLENFVNVVRDRRAGPSNTLNFDVRVADETRTRTVKQLKAVIGPDDDGKACLTVMLPEED